MCLLLALSVERGVNPSCLRNQGGAPDDHAKMVRLMLERVECVACTQLHGTTTTRCAGLPSMAMPRWCGCCRSRLLRVAWIQQHVAHCAGLQSAAMPTWCACC